MDKHTLVLTPETYFKLREIKEKVIKERNTPSISYDDIIKELIEEIE